PLPDQLAVLGRRVLGRVAGRPEGGRELALELLAADAFITYAFEAQAEADATGLAGLAQRIAGSEPCADCSSGVPVCWCWSTPAAPRRPRLRTWRVRPVRRARRGS